MKKQLSSLSSAFTSGVMGALMASLLLECADSFGLDRFLGFSLRHDFTLVWLYPRIVWGGVLGLLLLLPVPNITGWKKGLLLSLAPTTVEFFIAYPAAGAGNLGLKWGVWVPLITLGVNALGTVFAVFWAKKTGL